MVCYTGISGKLVVLESMVVVDMRIWLMVDGQVMKNKLGRFWHGVLE